MKKVDLILLAAGRSSRFGSNKLLYSLQGKPLFRHTAAALSPLPFHRRIVVTRTPEIAVSLQAEGYTAVLLPCSAENPGLSLSIQAGLMQAKEAEGYLFTVCDRPYMQTASYRLLLETFDTSGKGIACFTMPQEPERNSCSLKATKAENPLSAGIGRMLPPSFPLHQMNGGI